MFEGFQQKTDTQSRKSFAVSTGVSVSLYALAALGLIALASGAHKKEKKKPKRIVELARPRAAEPEPPPPPPPPPKPKPKRVAKASTDKSAPSIPDSIPEGALAEGDAADFRSEGVIPESVGPGPRQEEKPEPPPLPPDPEPEDTGPVIMPENAVPPRPLNTNRTPAYPEEARRKGIEGTVILKVVIDEKGDLGSIEVLRGEEPFVSAALAVVRQWSYEPATVDGETKAVYRIIKVPFRLRRS